MRKLNTSAQKLSELARAYRAHNDELAERLSDHVQACTLADLELIVRETNRSLERAMGRITALERRLGAKSQC